jgi:hypothetical protein
MPSAPNPCRYLGREVGDDKASIVGVGPARALVVVGDGPATSAGKPAGHIAPPTRRGTVEHSRSASTNESRASRRQDLLHVGLEVADITLADVVHQRGPRGIQGCRPADAPAAAP